MPAQNDPIERPEGLETRPESAPLQGDTHRPDWLVGADPGLEAPPGLGDPAPLSISKKAPLKVVEGGKPAASKGWSGAASSVPKLSVVPTTPPPQPMIEEDGVVESAGLDSDLPPAVGVPGDPSPVRATPAFRPLQEPWYLVWSEAVATQRRVQVLLLLVVAAVAAFFFFARGGTSGASLGAILRHPENYEGRSVVVRGEVLEIFDVGTGHAFQIRQGRDMVVVYSTLREPRLHDRVEVSGIVSTGYLDGKPRIAIFEGGAP